MTQKPQACVGQKEQKKIIALDAFRRDLWSYKMTPECTEAMDRLLEILTDDL